MTQEQMDEVKKIKEVVKSKNIDAVAQLLLDTREHNYKVQQEIGDLRKLVTTVLADNQDLRAQLNMTRGQLFALMGNGEMGQ